MVWPILAWSGLYASHRLLYTAVHCVYCGRRCMFPLLPLLYFCSAAGRVRHSLFELERQHLSMMFQEAAAHVRQQHAVNAPQATTTASSFASQNELIQISNDIKAHLCCVFCVRCVFFSPLVRWLWLFIASAILCTLPHRQCAKCASANVLIFLVHVYLVVVVVVQRSRW